MKTTIDLPLLKNKDFKVEKVWKEIEKTFKKSIVTYRDIPAIEGRYKDKVAFPYMLYPAVESILRKNIGDSDLYYHQGKAISLIQKGNNVVIETSTASGKSLCYLLPILNTLSVDNQATALYLSPLNALGSDQLELFYSWNDAINDSDLDHYREIKIGNSSIVIARYDGSLSKEQKDAVKSKHPRIVITNPDMMHWSLLPYNGAWYNFFKNLRYVVLDEVHEYNGYFGSSVACVLRRLKRICSHYGNTKVRFIACTATINNPRYVVESLIGDKVELVSRFDDGAKKYLKRFVLMNDASTGDTASLTKEVMSFLVTKKIPTITFTKSVQGGGYLLRQVQNFLSLKNRRDIDIALFTRSLTTKMKRDIINNLKSGEVEGVIATTALKLGIDVGNLAATVLMGYPDSMSTMFQQSGRSGRKSESFTFLVASKDPLNQFFVNHPNELFDSKYEDVLVNPNDFNILRNHIWCSCVDKPLYNRNNLIEGKIFQDSIDSLKKEGKIKQDLKSSYVNATEDYPPMKVPIRSLGFNFNVYDAQGNKVLEEESLRAIKDLHKGAVYQTIDADYKSIAYLVTNFNIDFEKRKGSATVEKLNNLPYYTKSLFKNDIFEDSDAEKIMYTSLLDACECAVVDAEIVSTYKGYWKSKVDQKDFSTMKDSKNKVDAEFEESPIKKYNFKVKTFKFSFPVIGEYWDELLVPDDMLKAYNSMIGALKIIASLYAFCQVSTIQTFIKNDSLDSVSLYICDMSLGGSGIAEKVYLHFKDILYDAYLYLLECPMSAFEPNHKGCPKCVTTDFGEDITVDRLLAMNIMKVLLKKEYNIEL